MNNIIYQVIFVLFVSSKINGQVASSNDFISDKLIAERSIITDIGITLNLTGVGLKEIGPNFIVNQYVSELILQKNELAKISYGAFDGLPALTRLDLSNNKLTARDFFSFGPHSNLETIIFDNNTASFTIVDLRISSTYPKLKNISLRRVKIETIPPAFSKYLPSLTHLDLSDNPINTDRTFKVLPKSVTHLYLEYAGLTSISNSFEELKNIKFLSLNRNSFIGQASPGHVDCYKNGILCLNLTNLETLTAAGCKISQVGANAFIKLGGLLSLNLANNPITSFNEKALKDVPKLSDIDLSGTFLSYPPNFKLTLNLTKLTMNDVKNSILIEELLKVNWGLSKLEHLSLSGNNLTAVPSEMIENLTKLKELNLSRNRITSLPSNLKPRLTPLRRLYLSDNLLTSIDDLHLNGTQSLELLDIQRNYITSFKATSFKHVPDNLTVLYSTACSGKLYNRN